MLAMTCTAADLTRGEQPPGEFVARRVAVGVGDGVELLVTRSGDRAIRLETDDAGRRTRLLGDSNQLTHRAAQP